MTEPNAAFTLRREADDAARRGDWLRVRALLAGVPDSERDIETVLLLAESHLRTANATSARELLEASLPELERTGGAVLRKGLMMLGAAYRAVGDTQLAEDVWKRVVTMAYEAGDQLSLARATNNLGIIANIRGDRRDALAKYQLAIPAYQNLGHVAGLAESFHNMAISYRDERELDQADECEQRAIEYALASANPRFAAAAKLGRAEVTYRRGDAVLCASIAGRVAREFDVLGDPVAKADATRLLGLTWLARGHLALAEESLHEALGTANVHHDTLLQAECHRALAELRTHQRQTDRAEEHVHRAIALYEQLGARGDADATRDWANDNLTGT